MASLNFNSIADLCIPIVASILGIALPIIIQTIGKIDERYNSIRLVKRFKKERLYLCFLWSLAFAILMLTYNNIVCMPWSRDWGVMNEFMRNSSNILTIISTSVLIVFLFLLILKSILYYYDYQKLFEGIKKRLYTKESIKEVIQEKDARDFVEMGKYVIRRDDNETSRDFYQFLYDFVVVKCKDCNFELIEYNNWLYDAILSLNDIVCSENIRPISIANGNDILKLLIPDYNPKCVISDKTYRVLWRALQQQLFYDRIDLVFEYWAHAHQYMSFSLKPIHKEIDFSVEPYVIKNEKEVKARQGQIMRFKEFNLALCGLMLYLKKYDLLKKVTSFSQSHPYSFPLIPSSFQEIVHQLTILNSIKPDPSIHFYSYYPFIGVKGVDTGDVSLGWTKRFLTLMLFRLNAVEVNYTINWRDSWEMPTIPRQLDETAQLSTIAERMKWFIEEWMSPDNLKVIELLGWVPKEKQKEPLEMINDLIKKLGSAVIEKKNNLKRSNAKVEKFNSSTGRIIKKTIDPYISLFNKCGAPPSDSIKNIINVSLKRVMEKEAFSDDQTMSFTNFDEFLAESVAYEFLYQCSISIYGQAKQFHTISDEYLFEALDKLIGEQRSDFVVLSFDTYLDFYLRSGKTNSEFKRIGSADESYPQYSYKTDLKIYSLPSNSNPLLESSFAIVKKEDLPCFVVNDPQEREQKEFKYKLVDEELRIFTSVLFEDFPDNMKEIGSDKCLVTIYYCPLLYWKKDASITILKTLSRYADSGKGIDISTLEQL